MCKAHVLRFSCSHGLLMSLEFCRGSPCPLLKATGKGLPQQPRRCHNCEKKRNESNASSTSSILSSCNSSVSSDDSLDQPTSLAYAMPKTVPKSARAGDYVMRPTLQSFGGSSYQKTFSFTCGPEHPPPPAYDALPAFLPHQNHACPSCQFEAVRTRSDGEIAADALSSWHLVKQDRQRTRRPAWEWMESLGAVERYVEERRQEEKEMLFMVARKWEQDLRALRVMCDAQGGTSLMA